MLVNHYWTCDGNTVIFSLIRQTMLWSQYGAIDGPVSHCRSICFDGVYWWESVEWPFSWHVQICLYPRWCLMITSSSSRSNQSSSHEWLGVSFCQVPLPQEWHGSFIYHHKPSVLGEGVCFVLMLSTQDEIVLSSSIWPLKEEMNLNLICRCDWLTLLSR